MSETTYIERYWRDANLEDAIKDPPMEARFGNGKDMSYVSKLCGTRRAASGAVLWYANGGGFYTHCQVYDAPDPGEGYELIDITKTTKQLGDEYLSSEGKWEIADASIFYGNLAYRRRIAPTVTYVPFTWEEREQLRGQWVYRDKQELQLVDFDNSDGFHANGVHVENLCKYWKFIDTGKPVGKEVTQ